MTFAEAARIMMSNGGTPQSTSYLDYISKSKWTKQIVDIPINNTYHYTINLVLFDDSSSLQCDLPAGCTWWNWVHVTSTTTDPPEYDLYSGVTMKKYSSICLYKICWKNDEPLYAEYLEQLVEYVPVIASTWYRNSIYAYNHDEYVINWDSVSGGGGGITYKYAELTKDYIKVPQPIVTVSRIGFGGPVTHNVYEFDSATALSSGTSKLKSTETIGIEGTTTLSNYNIKLFSFSYGLSPDANQLESEMRMIFYGIHHNYSGKYGADGIFLNSPSS